MSTNKKQTRQWGATFGFYAPRGSYSSPEAREEINALAATGANWVIVIVTVWQDEATSASQYRDCALTPDDLELAEIRGKKAEGVFSRWARGNSAHDDTAFPMAASAASATTTN